MPTSKISKTSERLLNNFRTKHRIAVRNPCGLNAGLMAASLVKLTARIARLERDAKELRQLKKGRK